MIILAFGIILFMLAHGVAASPRLKAAVKQRFGEKFYGPVFGLASLVSIAVIVLGWRQSPFVPVYDVSPLGWYVNYLMTFLGFLWLGVFLFRGTFRQRLRFPMAAAVILWSIGHLFANGDLASLILFGGFLVGTIAHVALALANGVRPTPEVRIGHDGLSLIFGAALYGIMTQLHGPLIGVPVFSLSH